METKLPTTHEALLRGHTSSISAVALDNAGTKLVAGALDSKLKIWDFTSMTPELRSACEKKIDQEAPITGACPLVLGCDGVEKCQFLAGDSSLIDVGLAKGHTAQVTGGQWHPTEPNRVLTASFDGSLRIWDAERGSCLHAIKFQPLASGSREVTACSYSPDGSLMCAGGSDGSLRLWDVKATGRYLRPDKQASDAHEKGKYISSIRVNNDKTLLVSRAMDNTMKLWDLRNFAAPIHVFTELENGSPRTDAIFDPHHTLLATGTSTNALKKLDRGKLMVYNTTTFELVQAVSLGNTSVMSLDWNAALNQIFAGCSDGAVRVLYDPVLSSGGVLAALDGHFTAKPREDFTQARPAEGQLKRKPELSLEASLASESSPQSRPAPPSSAPAPALGTAATFTQHIARQIALKKDAMRSLDPREAIVSYAEKAEADPMFFGCYGKTQPKPIFDTTATAEDERELKAANIASNRRQGHASNYRE